MLTGATMPPIVTASSINASAAGSDRVVVEMQRQDRIAGGQLVARHRMQDGADARIDRGVDALAARAERHGGAADRSASSSGEISRARRFHRVLCDAPGSRDSRRSRRVAALPLDDLAELLDARARRDRLAHHASPRPSSLSPSPASTQHPRREPHRQVFEIARAVALQRLDAFDDFERVADGAAERMRPSR